MGPDFGEPPSRAARAALKKTGKPSETTTGPAQHFLFLEKPAKGRGCADLERQQGGVLPAERGAPSRAGRSQQSKACPGKGGPPLCRFCTKRGSVTSPEGGRQKDTSSFASAGLLRVPEGPATSQKFLVRPGSQAGLLLREEERVKSSRAGEKACRGRGRGWNPGDERREGSPWLTPPHSTPPRFAGGETESRRPCVTPSRICYLCSDEPSRPRLQRSEKTRVPEPLPHRPASVRSRGRRAGAGGPRPQLCLGRPRGASFPCSDLAPPHNMGTGPRLIELLRGRPSRSM